MPSPPDTGTDDLPPAHRNRAARRHWRSVLTLTLCLLVVWFIAGPVLGILLADRLNGIRIGGFPLGFWFAQQGSILIFLILIAIYAIVMSRLDRRYRRDIQAATSAADRGAA